MRRLSSLRECLGSSGSVAYLNGLLALFLHEWYPLNRQSPLIKGAYSCFSSFLTMPVENHGNRNVHLFLSYSLLINSCSYWSGFLRFLSESSCNIAWMTERMEMDLEVVIRSPPSCVFQTTHSVWSENQEFLFGISWVFLIGDQTSLGSLDCVDRSKGWCWLVLISVACGL